MHQGVPGALAVTPDATDATSGASAVGIETHQFNLQLLVAATAVFLQELRVNTTATHRTRGF